MRGEFREPNAFVEDKWKVVAKDVDAGELLAVLAFSAISSREDCAIMILTKFEVASPTRVFELQSRL